MISNEYIIQRVGGGVRLTPPSMLDNYQYASMEAVLRLPINFYLLDTNSIIQCINHQTARTSGYLSTEDAIGKSIRDVSKRETINGILANDQEVITCQSYKITSESYLRFDGKDMTAITIKFPWIQNNKMTGVFGCSILLGDESTPSLPEALYMVMQTGLLSPNSKLDLPGFAINNQCFDHRDRDILHHLVRGKTAKQIARNLGLSFRTIEHRLEMIKLKLQVSSKSELIEMVVDKLLYRDVTISDGI